MKTKNVLKAEDFADNRDGRKTRSGSFQKMTKERRSEVARLGGLAVAKNRAHMSAIGKKGGKSVSKDTAWMSHIGKKGGHAARVQA